MMHITLNEQNIAPFATADHARAIIAALEAQGWQGLVYGQKREPWHFDTLRQYNQFMIDLENTIDQMTEVCSISLSWDCKCETDYSPWDCKCGEGEGEGGQA